MIDLFDSPTPLRNTIRHDPARPTKAEAIERAEARRAERGHEVAPRKFRDLSPQERIAEMRRRKRREREGGLGA